MEHGLAGQGRAVVGPMVLAAWDAFLAAAEAAELDRDTRLPGWRGHDVCVHLGLWPDRHALDDLVASAREGGTGTPPDVDAVNAAVVEAHRDASRDEVLDALRAHRDAVAAYLADTPVDLDLRPAMSTVGRLPLLSVAVGQCYELAVHQLDLEATGAPPPPADVLDDGVAALAEVTGALAAAKGIEARVTLWHGDAGWTFASDRSGGWTVTRAEGRRPRGTAVEAPARTLLEASAGRVNPAVQLARRRLKVHDMPGMLRLVPIVESTPGIPGGPLLQLAGRTLSGAGGLLGRFRPG